jgi:hypothetical protein
MRVKPGNVASSPLLSTLRFFLAVHACFALSNTLDSRFFDFSQERLWLVNALC